MANPAFSARLHQFPQPTRPLHAQETNPNPPIPQQEVFSQEFHQPEFLQLPKPTRPVAQSGPGEVQNYVKVSESTRTTAIPDPCPTTSSSSSEERVHLSPSTVKTPKEEREAVDELLTILMDCMEELNTRSRETLLMKFFSEIEREEKLERFIVERLKQSRVKAISDLCDKLPAAVLGRVGSDAGDHVLPTINEMEVVGGGDYDDLTSTRSIHESVEELTEKLERFKVRTLDLGGGLVKDDEDNTKK